MAKTLDQHIEEHVKVMRAVLAGESCSERADHFRLWAMWIDEICDGPTGVGEWLLRMAEALEGIE